MTDAVEGEIVNSGAPNRLTKHPEQTVRLLEAAFNNGFNITEACQYAEITRQTFYNWMEDDDIFSYRMSVAQSAPHRKAKQNVIEAISAGDPNISLAFLKLRDPDFKPKAALEVEPGSERVEQKLKEFMDDTDDGAYDAPANDVGAEPATQPVTEG